jgi:hypothetical protein
MNRDLVEDKEWLNRQYILLKKSTYEIAEICNCSSVTIQRRLKKFGIKIRTTKEACNTKKHKQKLSEMNIGERNPMYGKHHTNDSKKRISKSISLKIGDKSNKWKDNWDELSYGGRHKRMKSMKEKPEKCEICGNKRKLVIMNKDHKYTEDINKWQWVCWNCHQKYDYNYNNRTRKGKK